MRPLAELAAVLGGFGTVIKFFIWPIIDRRIHPKSNVEHVRQLLEDNKEIDEINNQLTRR